MSTDDLYQNVVTKLSADITSCLQGLLPQKNISGLLLAQKNSE